MESEPSQTQVQVPCLSAAFPSQRRRCRPGLELRRRAARRACACCPRVATADAAAGSRRFAGSGSRGEGALFGVEPRADPGVAGGEKMGPDPLKLSGLSLRPLEVP